MLPILESMSYCWLLIPIYNQLLNNNHRQSLFVINYDTKKIRILGVTRVEPYQHYILPGGKAGEYRVGENQLSLGLKTGIFCKRINANY